MPDPSSQRLRAMIYARSENNVIGQNGQIPWRYAGDLKRFKRVTMGSAIVMGRRTFVSIGRALPGRKNIVLTSRGLPTSTDAERALLVGIETATSIEEALLMAGAQDVWFIGGGFVYEMAMPFVSLIDETIVPIDVPLVGDGILETVFAPKIEPEVFEAEELAQHEDEPSLKRRIYRRR
jgi:dihydrofolate reductase